jgi:hypothetical protein
MPAPDVRFHHDGERRPSHAAGVARLRIGKSERFRSESCSAMEVS